MTGEEFEEIRKRLGLSRKQVAAVLGYTTQAGPSQFTVNRYPVTRHVARLMHAYDEGYRPKDWPQIDELFQPEIKGGKRANHPSSKP